MTSPHDFTAAQAADPSTPQALLGEIATHRPDLRPAVAANPAAYPELLTWLGSLGDSAVDRALAARAGQVPGGPGATFTPQASQPGGAGTQDGAQGYGAAGGYAQSPQAEGYGAQAGGFGPPAAGYGATSGDGQWWGPQQPAKRSRKGLWIGAGVAGVLVLGGGAFAANELWFSKVGGAGSPEEAATKLIEGAADKDLVAVYGMLSPTEVTQMTTGFELFRDRMPDAMGEDDAKDTFEDYIDAFEFELTGLDVDVEEIEDGLAKVSIVGGELEVDADAEKLSDATVALFDRLEASSLWETFELGEQADLPGEDEIRDVMTSGVEENFPTTVTAEDLVVDASELAADFDMDVESEPIDPFLMVVEEDGDWYVSPYLTMMEYATMSQDIERGSMPSDDLAGAYDSPEAAAEGAVAGLVEFYSSGEIDPLMKSYPLADRRLMSLYTSQDVLESLDAAELDELNAVLETLDISATFTERDVDGGKDGVAWLKLDTLSVEGEYEGIPVSMTLTAECFEAEAEGETISGCLEDIPALEELGLGELSLIATEEDGSWYISTMGTAGDATGIIGSNAVRLYEDGKLTDQQWWEDNLGVIAEELF